jgi:regulator of protease activity HflC (stomatin/prohibitin superfamily)
MKAKQRATQTAGQKDSYRRSEMEFGVAADTYRSDPGNKATRNGAVAIQIVLALVMGCVVLGVWDVVAGKLDLLAIIVSVVVFLAALTSIHVCMDWERVVVMRMGKYNRLAGPGLFFTIPLFEFCTLRVDQRMNATPFGAEEALTSDLVPIDVDAVLFWVIWDPEKACTEVEDCRFAVALTAQTALRDAIGRASLSNVVMRRHQLDKELAEAVSEKVSDWGVSIVSVEVRDLIIPKELQEVMSLEAQAECRKSARITLMEAERDVSEILDEVAQTYSHDAIALDLRKLHLTYEGMQSNGNSLVVPSSYADGFTNDIGSSQEGVGQAPRGHAAASTPTKGSGSRPAR